MKDKNPSDQLGRHLSDLESHLNAGVDRIKAAYFESVDPPEGFPELEKSPDEIMFERSSKLVYLAAKELAGRIHTIRSPIPEAEYLLYGTAAEILVNGVHLQCEPESFIQYWEETGKTPCFEESWDVMISDLGSKLSDEDRGVLTVTLQILRKHRNNLVHFGFHQGRFSSHRPLFWEIFAECFRYYSEDPPRDVLKLEEEIEKYRGENAGSAELQFSI